MHVCMKQNKESSLATEERVANESSEIGGLMNSMSVRCRTDSSPRDINVLEALSRDI
jgi:hypothetical protein